MQSVGSRMYYKTEPGTNVLVVRTNFGIICRHIQANTASNHANFIHVGWVGGNFPSSLPLHSTGSQFDAILSS